MAYTFTPQIRNMLARAGTRKPPKIKGLRPLSDLQDVLNPPSPIPKPEPLAPLLNYADPQYVGALAQGNLPFEQAYARLPGDVGALASNYGYTTNFTPGEIDPTTGLAGDPTVNVTGIDTSNPYSRAALLQKSYDQTRAGNTTNYAARGQLYAGSLGNAQNAAQTNFNTSSEGLRGSFNEQVRQWLGGLGGARQAAGAARTGALGELTAKGLEHPIVSPGPPPRTDPDIHLLPKGKRQRPLVSVPPPDQPRKPKRK